MVFRGAIDAERRAYFRFLMEIQGAKRREIVRKYNISHASLYRILDGAKSTSERNVCGKRIPSMGRPRKLTPRDERLLLRKIDVLRRQEGSFTIKDLCEAGISPRTVSCKTVRRLLHRHGYKYVQARKKGVLTQGDQEKRLKFARNIKREYSRSVWTEEIAFYLDGVSFIHKYNPADQARAARGRIWRKPEEGLSMGCTAKEAHCGSRGRMAKFMVAISCDQYDKLDGLYFKNLIEREFSNMFERANEGDSKLWVQDGDPSQNSALARSSWLKVGARLLPIPPRTPDINPIENIFKLVKARLAKDVLDNNITWESFEDFSERVRKTIPSMDKGIIDKTITSMNKRMDLIISKKGGRTKY